VKILNRKSKVELRNLLDRQRHAAGIISLTGTAKWSKDELLNELAHIGFPPVQMNEARDVYYASVTP
jgi:hypothetical protein